jgi:hypothetical protein
MSRQSRTLTLRHLSIAVVATCAAALAGATAAEAKTKHHHHTAHMLTVKKRPFTDAGRVVPVGTEANYVTDATMRSRTPDFYTNPGAYGGETLPGRFGTFGN